MSYAIASVDNMNFADMNMMMDRHFAVDTHKRPPVADKDRNLREMQKW